MLIQMRVPCKVYQPDSDGKSYCPSRNLPEGVVLQLGEKKRIVVGDVNENDDPPKLTLREVNAFPFSTNDPRFHTFRQLNCASLLEEDLPEHTYIVLHIHENGAP